MNSLRLIVFAFSLLLLSFSSLAQDTPFSNSTGTVKVGNVGSGTLQVPYIFWGGDVATFYANGGLSTQSNSIFAKQGIQMNLVAGDDFVQQVKDYMSGKSPFLRCTMGMLAQAMINKPRILLMDEPFSALDEQNREKFQRMLLTLRTENEKEENKENPPFTMMIVTHEINEAIYVGDRVIGFSQNWNWKEQGYESFPGATVVYNEKAPVFNPYEKADYSTFVDQKADILEKVFGKEKVKESWENKIKAAHVNDDVAVVT
jgi:ABC-type taurine transport system ATPase subunit